MNLVRGGARGFLLNVLFALLSVSVTLLVCAGDYLKCMLIIFAFYIIDNGVGAEILI